MAMAASARAEAVARRTSGSRQWRRWYAPCSRPIRTCPDRALPRLRSPRACLRGVTRPDRPLSSRRRTDRRAADHSYGPPVPIPIDGRPRGFPDVPALPIFVSVATVPRVAQLVEVVTAVTFRLDTVSQLSPQALVASIQG